MNYVDVEEFARITDWTPSYIRRLCRENKVNNITETVPQTGKNKYLIDLDGELTKIYLSKINPVPPPSTEPKTQHYTETLPQQNLINADVIEILEKFEGYILKAGKYELLEDKQRELKDDVTHWQSKYFEEKYRADALERENKVLKQEAEQVKKPRPFWKF